MDYICKRKNNIQSISITADCTGPRDKDSSQLTHPAPRLLPFSPTLDWKLRLVLKPDLAPPILSSQMVSVRSWITFSPRHFKPTASCVIDAMDI